MSDALAIREDEAIAPLALFGTTDPVQVIEVAARVATALADVVNKRQLYAIVNGKKFPTVEAWTLLGSMLGVFPITEWSRPLLNEDGSVRGYEARVRAQTLSGRVVGSGEAMCVRGESRTWHANAQEFAIRSMAQTRATSKALRGPLDFVFKLAGFQPTPAEEMTDSTSSTGEIQPSQASQASRAALAEWQERHERQQAETDQVTAGPPPTITGNSGSDEILPPGQIGVLAATGSVEPQPAAKRRGRPLGSKNAAKVEQGAQSERSTASGQMSVSAVAKTSAPPAGFGEEEVSVEEGWLRELRSNIRKLASRLRKYQYMEQGRELPPIDLWNKEVERTLGIYIERKFGTEVVLDDVEEAGLIEALSELKGYIAKYESAEENETPIGQGEARGMEGTPLQAVSPAPDAVVSLHKPIMRNPVAAQRRDPTAIDPKVALDRARALAELRNRTTALLAIREGKVNLSAQDEERLRGQADATMEKVAQNAFSKAIKELDVEQLQLLNERAKAAAK